MAKTDDQDHFTVTKREAVLQDIIDAKITEVQTMMKGSYVLTVPSGQTTTAALAQALKDRIDRRVPAFGTSQVPQTVQLGFTVEANPALESIVGPVKARADVTLNFQSDDELAPTVPNPFQVGTIHGDGLLNLTVEGAVVTWRDPEDPLTIPEAIEQLARTYGWNPEGAEAMGFTEVSLAEWFQLQLAKAKP